MRNILITAICALMIISCKNTVEEVVKGPQGNVEKVLSYKKDGDKKLLKKEIRYYPNGNKQSEGEYDDNGKRNGSWKYWYDNGNMWSEGDFLNGSPHGKTKVYFTDGKPMYTGEYNHGEPDGKWTFFNADGSVQKKAEYKNGKKVSEE